MRCMPYVSEACLAPGPLPGAESSSYGSTNPIDAGPTPESGTCGSACGITIFTPPPIAPSDKELNEHVAKRVRTFKRNIGGLESAIGRFFAGEEFRWKVMLLVHDRKTIKTYEQLLERHAGPLSCTALSMLLVPLYDRRRRTAVHLASCADGLCTLGLSNGA